jgi:hypothetical protein
MEFLMQTLVTFFLLGPKILLTTQVSNTINLCSFLNMKDRAFHTYTKTSNISYRFDILIVKTLYLRGEDRRFQREWQQALSIFTVFLISS